MDNWYDFSNYLHYEREGYVPLGEDIPHHHSDLLEQRDEYEMALPILNG
jgi:hypothetical protein